MTWDWQQPGTVLISETIDQVRFLLPLFVHRSVHRLQKPPKSHCWCLQGKQNKIKTTTSQLFSRLCQRKPNAYLYKQCVGQKGQLPECSSTQTFAFAGKQSEHKTLTSSFLNSHWNSVLRVWFESCCSVGAGTHIAMFLRVRLCSHISLFAKPIVSSSGMVNSCCRGWMIWHCRHSASYGRDGTM